MANTKAKRNKHQGKVLKRNGLSPTFWTVLTERETYMILKHRVTGEIKHINK